MGRRANPLILPSDLCPLTSVFYIINSQENFVNIRGIIEKLYKQRMKNYSNSRLPIIASVSILPLAYSIVLPVGSPLASRVIFTSAALSSELI